MSWFRKNEEEKQKDEEFKEFEKNLSGLFKTWDIDHYHADKDDCSLWIANGYNYFRDEGDERLLEHIAPKYQRALWAELQSEIARRSRKAVMALVIENGKAKRVESRGVKIKGEYYK